MSRNERIGGAIDLSRLEKLPPRQYLHHLKDRSRVFLRIYCPVCDCLVDRDECGWMDEQTARGLP